MEFLEKREGRRAGVCVSVCEEYYSYIFPSRQSYVSMWEELQEQ